MYIVSPLYIYIRNIHNNGSLASYLLEYFASFNSDIGFLSFNNDNNNNNDNIFFGRHRSFGFG